MESPLVSPYDATVRAVHSPKAPVRRRSAAVELEE